MKKYAFLTILLCVDSKVPAPIVMENTNNFIQNIFNPFKYEFSWENISPWNFDETYLEPNKFIREKSFELHIHHIPTKAGSETMSMTYNSPDDRYRELHLVLKGNIVSRLKNLENSDTCQILEINNFGLLTSSTVMVLTIRVCELLGFLKQSLYPTALEKVDEMSVSYVMKNGIYWPMNFLFFPDLDFKTELFRSFKEHVDILNLASAIASSLNKSNLTKEMEQILLKLKSKKPSIDKIIAQTALYFSSAAARGYRAYFPPRHTTSILHEDGGEPGPLLTLRKSGAETGATFPIVDAGEIVPEIMALLSKVKEGGSNRLVEMLISANGVQSLTKRDRAGLAGGLGEMSSRWTFPRSLKTFVKNFIEGDGESSTPLISHLIMNKLEFGLIEDEDEMESPVDSDDDWEDIPDADDFRPPPPTPTDESENDSDEDMDIEYDEIYATGKRRLQSMKETKIECRDTNTCSNSVNFPPSPKSHSISHKKPRVKSRDSQMIKAIPQKMIKAGKVLRSTKDKVSLRFPHEESVLRQLMNIRKKYFGDETNEIENEAAAQGIHELINAEKSRVTLAYRYPFRDAWQSRYVSERALRSYLSSIFRFAGDRSLSSSTTNSGFMSASSRIGNNFNTLIAELRSAGALSLIGVIHEAINKESEFLEVNKNDEKGSTDLGNTDLMKVAEFCEALGYLHNLSTLEFASHHLQCPVALPNISKMGGTSVLKELKQDQAFWSFPDVLLQKWISKSPFAVQTSQQIGISIFPPIEFVHYDVQFYLKKINQSISHPKANNKRILVCPRLNSDQDKGSTQPFTPEGDYCVHLIDNSDTSVCGDATSPLSACPLSSRYVIIPPKFIYSSRTDSESPILYQSSSLSDLSQTHPMNSIRQKLFHLTRIALGTSRLVDEAADLWTTSSNAWKSQSPEGSRLAGKLLYYRWVHEQKNQKKEEDPNNPKKEDPNNPKKEDPNNPNGDTDHSSNNGDNSEDSPTSNNDDDPNAAEFTVPVSDPYSCRATIGVNDADLFFSTPTQSIDLSDQDLKAAKGIQMGISYKWFSPIIALLIGKQPESFSTSLKSIAFENKRRYKSFLQVAPPEFIEQTANLLNSTNPLFYLAFSRFIHKFGTPDLKKSSFVWAWAVIHASEGANGDDDILEMRMQSDPHYRPNISIIPIDGVSIIDDNGKITGDLTPPLLRSTAIAVALLNPDEIDALTFMGGIKNLYASGRKCRDSLISATQKLWTEENGEIKVDDQAVLSVSQVEFVLNQLMKRNRDKQEKLKDDDTVNPTNVEKQSAADQRAFKSVRNKMLTKTSMSQPMQLLGGFLDECMESDWGVEDNQSFQGGDNELRLFSSEIDQGISKTDKDYLEMDGDKLIFPHVTYAFSNNKKSAKIVLDFHRATPKSIQGSAPMFSSPASSKDLDANEDKASMKPVDELNDDPDDASIDDGPEELVVIDNMSLRAQVHDAVQHFMSSYDINNIDPIIHQESCQYKLHTSSMTRANLCTGGVAVDGVGSSTQSSFVDSEELLAGLTMPSLCVPKVNARSRLFGWGEDEDMQQTALMAEACPIWRAAVVLRSMPLVRHSTSDTATADFGGVRHQIDPHDFCSCVLRGGESNSEIDCI